MRYSSLKLLREGKVLNMERLLLVIDEGEIEIGDLYVAERNTGPKLLTAREIIMFECGCCFSHIHPADFPAYSFDYHECVKVREA